MLSRAVEGGYFTGFQVGTDNRGFLTVSSVHFLFTDDTIMFAATDLEQLGYIRAVLVCFEVVPVGDVGGLLTKKEGKRCRRYRSVARV